MSPFQENSPRTLIFDPEFIVTDESVSIPPFSVQSKCMNKHNDQSASIVTMLHSEGTTNSLYSALNLVSMFVYVKIRDYLNSFRVLGQSYSQIEGFV